jgi:hypothetical protein
MKPKPFSALNHLTVPVAMTKFPSKEMHRSRDPGPRAAWIS